LYILRNNVQTNIQQQQQENEEDLGLLFWDELTTNNNNHTNSNGGGMSYAGISDFFVEADMVGNGGIDAGTLSALGVMGLDVDVDDNGNGNGNCNAGAAAAAGNSLDASLLDATNVNDNGNNNIGSGGIILSGGAAAVTRCLEPELRGMSPTTVTTTTTE